MLHLQKVKKKLKKLFVKYNDNEHPNLSYHIVDIPSYRIKRHTHNIKSGIIAISIAEKRYAFIKINVGVFKPSDPIV